MILPLLWVTTAWAQTTTTDASKDAELSKRLTERKNNMQAKLTSFQQQTVKLRCEAAQGKIKVVQGRLNGKAAERLPRYTNALEKLRTLSAKLKAGGVDTTALNAQIKELETLVKTYQDGYTEFKQQIDDLVAMDCKADPDGFKATLLEARAKRTTVVQTANDIQTFMATKLKPTLLVVRQSVVNKPDNQQSGGQR